MKAIKTLILLLCVTVMLTYSVAAASVCDDNYEIGSGDWVIDTAVTCSKEAFTVNGNITITSGGNLTIAKSKITLDPSHGEASFSVLSASDGVTIKDSTIQANTGEEYVFTVASTFEAKDSTIKNIGKSGVGAAQGLHFKTEDVIVDGLTVTESESGIVIEADNIKLKDLRVTDTEKDAVKIVDGDNTLLEFCTFSSIGNRDIYVASGAGSDVIKANGCSFNSSNIKVDDNDAEVRVGWFVDIFVNNSTGPVENALVKVENNQSELVLSGYTDSNGLLSYNTIAERSIFKSSTDDYNTHSFFAELGLGTCLEGIDVIGNMLGGNNVVLSLGASGCGDSQ